MKRRDFLKTASGLYLAGGASWARAAQTRADEKIVVIGAGMAGLAAAGALRERGFDVLVVEARDRIGGRINTDRSLGCAVDLGASWIHGIKGNPLTELARAAGSDLQRTRYDRVLPFDDDGTRLDAGLVLRSELRMEASVAAAVRQAQEKGGRDVSLKTALDETAAGADLSPRERRAFNLLLATEEIDSAARIDQLSTRDDDRYRSYGGGDWLVVDGYQKIARRLAADLDIRTGVAVMKVDHSGPRIKLETNQGQLEADRVIVAVPLGILKADKIAFSPGLPDAKQAAIDRVGMGVFNKVALRFDKPFWPAEPHFIMYAAEQRGAYPTFVNLLPYAGQPVLVCLVPPSFEDALEDLSADEAQRGALAVLRTMFGNDVPEPAGVLQTRWKSDPWALGSYSFDQVGIQPADRDQLAAPVDDRLFFAGEATSAQRYATVHGAYLSGLRAVEELSGPFAKVRG